MSAWLIDINGNFIEIKGEIEKRIADFIMRLQTIKGEQSFNANNGIDFLNIINGRTLAEIDIENTAMDFNNYFDVKVKKAERDLQKKILKINIEIKLKNNTNNEIIDYQLLIGA